MKNLLSNPDPPFYDVASFCAAHQISRAYLYTLWSDGKGPRRTKLGRRTLITGQAAQAWRRKLEQETGEPEQRPAG